MARVLIVAGLAALAFAVFAVVDCALTERARVRALPRVVWILLILVLPVLGGALWFLIGAGRRGATPVRRYVGPDDDPDFIRGTGSAPAAPPVGDEEWRRLEQELSGMDSEADSDDDGDARRR